MKSNRITKAKFSINEDVRYLAKKLLQTQDPHRREFYAEAIVHDLCDAARIPVCKVEIADKPQLHRKNQRGSLRLKILGHYTSGSQSIVVYHRTAIQKKVVAGKTFLRCLIHEFMHHYDFNALKIRSLHTSGFYQRLNFLFEQVL